MADTNGNEEKVRVTVAWTCVVAMRWEEANGGRLDRAYWQRKVKRRKINTNWFYFQELILKYKHYVQIRNITYVHKDIYPKMFTAVFFVTKMKEKYLKVHPQEIKIKVIQTIVKILCSHLKICRPALSDKN